MLRRWVVTLVVVAAALAVAVPAGLAARTETPTEKAVAACQAKGIPGGTAQFQACVNEQLGAQGGAGGQGGQAGAGGQGGGQGGQGQGGAGQGGQGAPGTTTAVTVKGATPQAQAAIDACVAKGLQPGTDAFRACLTANAPAQGGQGGGQGGGGGGQGAGSPANLTGTAKAAYDGCRAKGFNPGTQAFDTCYTGFLRDASGGRLPGSTTPASGAGSGGTLPDPATQAANKACAAKGLAQGSDAMKSCMMGVLGITAKAQAQGKTTPSAEVQAAAAACAAKGFAAGSDALASCIKSIVGVGNGQPQQGGGGQPPAIPQAARDAAVKACTAKGATGTKLAPCVNGLLAQAGAMAECSAQGLDQGGDAWKACVKKRLGAK